MALTNLTVTPVSQHEINIEWDQEELTASLQVSITGAFTGEQTNYDFNPIAGGHGAVIVGSQVGDPLVAGTTYYFRVTEDEGASWASASAATYGIASSPMEYVATADNPPAVGQINAMEDYPSSGDRSYAIHYIDNASHDQHAIIDAAITGDKLTIDTTVMEIGSISAGTGYVIVTLATPGEYISLSPTQAYSVRIGPPKPAAPENFAATRGTSTAQISLSWDATTGALSYEVWRNSENNSGTATKIAEGLEVASFYDRPDSFADPANAWPIGQPAFYWVCAVNYSGTSDKSATADGWRALNLAYVPAASSVVDGTACINAAGNDYTTGSYPESSTTSTAQHTADAAFLELHKDEILQTGTNIFSEFGVTGTATSGGGCGGGIAPEDIVSATLVKDGETVYPGGPTGSYPTTEDTQAASAEYYAGVIAASYTANSVVSSDYWAKSVSTHNDVVASDYNPKTSSVLLSALTQSMIASGTTINPTTGTSGAVSGSFTHTADYVLKSSVVSKAFVVIGNDNFPGGDPGEYPTTATSKAAQLTDDRAAVNAVKAYIVRPADGGPATVLDTITGTFNASEGGGGYGGPSHYDPYIMRPF